MLPLPESELTLSKNDSRNLKKLFSIGGEQVPTSGKAVKLLVKSCTTKTNFTKESYEAAVWEKSFT